MQRKTTRKPVEHVVVRSGRPDLKFTGTQLARVRVDDHQVYSFGYQEAAIYRTVGGNYVAQFRKAGTDGRIELERGAKCTTAAEIVDFYTDKPFQPTGPVKRRRGASNDESPTKAGVGHLVDIGKLVLDEAGRADEMLRDAHIEAVE